jgi:hypothetical protein
VQTGIFLYWYGIDMASTRNKNTRGNYALELNKSIHMQEYMLHTDYGEKDVTFRPGDGLGGARLPSTHLSSNPVEIESFLLGIGSSDLTKPTAVLSPDLKCLPQIDLFKKRGIVMPDPFYAQTDQRPLRR